MAHLSREQCSQYEQAGYLILPGVLDATDLEPIKCVLSEHVDREARHYVEAGQLDDLYADLPFEKRLAAVYGPLDRQSIGWNKQIFSKPIYDFGMQSKILDIAESLVGPELQFNGDYWVRTKLPGEAMTTLPWHQDSGYYGGKVDFQILSLWIPLVDVDTTNGCLQVIPGSHKWGLLPTKENELGHREPVDDIEARGEIVTLPMKAGDIFAFHDLTFHRSQMNHSDHIRWSIDLRYSEIGKPLDWLFRACMNGFVARSRENPDQVDSWAAWQAKRAAAVAARAKALA
ncbi:MAG: phytanoyl-CoA dioxygenase family protein [Verrucomicrobia bacterium]|nr:phytanoyl-CoA dioxygenase family protein [Verrucomicrobiota bacterium]